MNKSMKRVLEGHTWNECPGTFLEGVTQRLSLKAQLGGGGASDTSLLPRGAWQD